MSSTDKQDRIEELLRKSLLGGELIDTQFHLFSARSDSSGRVVNPRVLAANNVLLAKSSTYFSELLTSHGCPSDGRLLEVDAFDQVPQAASIDDYGYASDSDLGDDDPPPGLGKGGDGLEIQAKMPTSLTPMTSEHEAVHEHCSDSDSESVTSDLSVLDSEEGDALQEAPVQLATISPETTNKDTFGSVNQVATGTRLRLLGSRRIVVTDTAFQTWYTLLYYLYTGRATFLPLRSSGTQPCSSSMSFIDEPKCSPKSMYRLACKVGLDDLRDKAVAAIRTGLTEHNILTELSNELVSRHPPLLEMELDVLYSHIASAPVITGLSNLASRIANKELQHGADIIIGLHARLLKEHHPLALVANGPQPCPSPPAIPGSAVPLGADYDTAEPFSSWGAWGISQTTVGTTIPQEEPPRLPPASVQSRAGMAAGKRLKTKK